MLYCISILPPVDEFSPGICCGLPVQYCTYQFDLYPLPQDPGQPRVQVYYKALYMCTKCQHWTTNHILLKVNRTIVKRITWLKSLQAMYSTNPCFINRTLFQMI